MPSKDIDREWELALAKFAVIAPLVCRDLEPAAREALRKEIVAAAHLFPGDRLRRFAPRTVREWIALYRQHGLEGLRGGPRKDKGKPRAVPQAVIERAKALKVELPKRSAETISNLLAAEGLGLVSPSTVRYHLRNDPPEPAAGAAEPPKVFRRFEHAHPNDCWQSDMTQGLWLPDPADPAKRRLCHLHAFLDDHSRKVMHAQFYWRESLPALENCFRQALARHGVPSMAYWDNGAAYRATQLRRMAARLRVEIVFATPYSPEGKGKIERFWATLKGALYPEAERADIQTLDELNKLLWAWLEAHYTHRVHSQTGQTPHDRWEAGRHRIREVSPEELADTFLWEDERHVTKTGEVCLGGNRYPVPATLVGQRVVVRYDPYDLAEVKVLLRGQLVGTFRPTELVAKTFAKARPHDEGPPRPLDSSKRFKDRLVEQAGAKDANWMALAAGQPAARSADELAAQLGALLGDRVFDEAERQALVDFQRRFGPRPEAVERAVGDAVALKGPDRPLAYYLEAIEARLRDEGGRA